MRKILQMRLLLTVGIVLWMGLPRAVLAASSRIQGSCPSGYVDTAVGCISYNSSGVIANQALLIAIGVGGGVALLLLAYAGFMIMTSSGNPDRLQAGRELLTSALAGVILIVFSVFLLEIIGVDILRIPGFA